MQQSTHMVNEKFEQFVTYLRQNGVTNVMLQTFWFKIQNQT